jgi:oligosaccharide repeat unit polymerase
VTAVAAHLPGVSLKPQEESGDFLLVPLFTNVYTALSRYYIDYGFTGMLIAMFLFGVGQTWLFWKGVNGDPFYLFLFAITLYPLSMIAFDDTYTLFGHYFAELVFAIVYFRLLCKVPTARALDRRIATASVPDSAY